MTISHVISYGFAVLFLVQAFLFLKGSSDRLIAGYNTASKEEREKVDIKRLRILMFAICVLGAVFCGAMPFLEKYNGAVVGAVVALMCFTLLVIILANTWARKK